MPPNRNLATLRDGFRERAETFVHVCKDDLKLTFRVTETLRSQKRQAELEAAGKSTVKIGFHNFGLALDFALFIDGEYLRDDISGLYTRCGFVAKALGMRWGGDWSRFKDYGHVEDAGYTLQQLLNGIKGGVVTS